VREEKRSEGEQFETFRTSPGTLAIVGSFDFLKLNDDRALIARGFLFPHEGFAAAGSMDPPRAIIVASDCPPTVIHAVRLVLGEDAAKGKVANEQKGY